MPLREYYNTRNRPVYGISAGTNCSIKGCNASGDAFGNDYGIVVGNNSTVIDCTASDNLNDGIEISNNCAVRDCTASDNDNDGIRTQANNTVSGCTANANSNVGIYTQENCAIVGCTASSDDYGIAGNDNCSVKDCACFSNLNAGVAVYGDSMVSGCTTSMNFQGIYLEEYGSQIVGNTCSGNVSSGIVIGFGGGNRLDNNTTANNGNYGIDPGPVANVTNSITRNVAPNNHSGGYNNTAGNNDYAPIQTPSTATSPWANF